MNYQKKYIISDEDDGTRLDLFLVQQSGLSRAKVQKDIKGDIVLVNNEPAKKVGQVLRPGYVITFSQETHVEIVKRVVPQEVIDGIVIVAETPDYVVVNKPAGILMHPTQANEPVTLASEIIKKYPEMKGVGESDVRPGIVHRIDREASGIIVMARNQKMYDHLKRQFQVRTVNKEYSVLVHGFIEKDYDLIDFSIDRGTDGKMVSRPYVKAFNLQSIRNIQDGKDSLTEIWVEKRLVRYSLLKVKIHSGRTHQIRVHMYAYNHPVLGDTLYYNKKLIKNRDVTMNRLFLHAKTLGFRNLQGEEVSYTYDLPVELQSFVDSLEK